MPLPLVVWGALGLGGLYVGNQALKQTSIAADSVSRAVLLGTGAYLAYAYIRK